MLQNSTIKHEGLTLNVISVDKAFKEESSSLWVLNRTSPRGVMLINVASIGGRMNTIKIPATFAPIDVTMFETKENLLSSPQFRRQVGLMSIVLVSEKDARELMNLAHVSEEYRRLYPELAEFQTQEQDSRNEATPDHAMPEMEDNVHPMIQNLIGGAEGYKEEHALSTLRSRASDFSATDLTYLANRAPWGSVKTWASEALAQR